MRTATALVVLMLSACSAPSGPTPHERLTAACSEECGGEPDCALSCLFDACAEPCSSSGDECDVCVHGEAFDPCALPIPATLDYHRGNDVAGTDLRDQITLVDGSVDGLSVSREERTHGGPACHASFRIASIDGAVVMVSVQSSIRGQSAWTGTSSFMTSAGLIEGTAFVTAF